MKKILTALIVVIITLVSFKPLPVHAQSTSDPDRNFGVADDTLTQETIDSFNPLIRYGDPATTKELSTPGGVLSRALSYAFPIAGLILFVMLVWSGFEILGGATERKSLDSGKQRATAAIIGFVLLFASYWFVQIIEVVFGVQIL